MFPKWGDRTCSWISPGPENPVQSSDLIHWYIHLMVNHQLFELVRLMVAYSISPYLVRYDSLYPACCFSTIANYPQLPTHGFSRMWILHGTPTTPGIPSRHSTFSHGGPGIPWPRQKQRYCCWRCRSRGWAAHWQRIGRINSWADGKPTTWIRMIWPAGIQWHQLRGLYNGLIPLLRVYIYIYLHIYSYWSNFGWFSFKLPISNE